MNAKQYMDVAARVGCVACLLDGFVGTPAQLHHPRAEAGMSERGDDMDVIPLCPAHHLRGGTYTDGHRFPGVHQNTAAFRARYGEDWLLTEVTRRLVAMDAERTIGKMA